MNLKFVTLENGLDYMIISETNINDVKYLYLVNENDEDDYCIRKVVKENGEEMLTALDNNEELHLALKLFNN